MSATVICFETFRLERDRRRGDNSPETVEPAVQVPFLREPGVALTPRQIAHRQTMIDYWNQRRRAMFGVFRETALREAVTDCE
jgi:hypothetical protein